jgi:hypothetical protein
MSKRTAGRNNFKNPEIRDKAIYKIWVLLKPEFCSKYNVKKAITRYGFNNKKNRGIDNLVRLAETLEKEAELIHLYDNQQFDERGKRGKLIKTLYQSKPSKTLQQ